MIPLPVHVLHTVSEYFSTSAHDVHFSTSVLQHTTFGLTGIGQHIGCWRRTTAAHLYLVQKASTRVMHGMHGHMAASPSCIHTCLPRCGASFRARPPARPHPTPWAIQGNAMPCDGPVLPALLPEASALSTPAALQPSPAQCSAFRAPCRRPSGEWPAACPWA